MKKLLAVITLIAVSGVVSACGSSSTPTAPTPAPTPPPAAVTPAPTAAAPDAAKLYQTNCVVCHGAKREGVTGLGKPLTPTSLANLTDDQVKTTISAGKPNTAMVGFSGRLTPAEIDALVTFIKQSAP